MSITEDAKGLALLQALKAAFIRYRRVYELLDVKFRLFDGVFSASDEILGAVESGVDFEQRIADIYQRCREPAEIHQAFEQLQLDLAGEISDAMLNARQVLLENFDEEVQARLKLAQTDAEICLDRLEHTLMRFSRAMLSDDAVFDPDGLGFELQAVPVVILSTDAQGEDIPVGRYELPRPSDEAHIYRLQHPLAQGLLQWALNVPLAPVCLALDYEAYAAQVAALRVMKGEAGCVLVQCLTVRSLGASEEFLIMAATAGGQLLDADLTDKLLALPGTAMASSPAAAIGQVRDGTPSFGGAALQATLAEQERDILSGVEQRNLKFFAEESDKLDAWADDMKVGLEREIKELDRRIKETRNKGKGAATLAEKLAAQREQRDLEAARDRKRRELLARQDEIQARRDTLIDELEQQLSQHVAMRTVLACEWVMR